MRLHVPSQISRSDRGHQRLIFAAQNGDYAAILAISGVAAGWVSVILWVGVRDVFDG